MKKLIAVAVLAMACATPAMANLLVNGDFSAGETGWTHWRAPWGTTETWDASSGAGVLAGQGGNGSYGWWQMVPVTAGTVMSVSADWMGNIGGAGWAEVMLYTRASAGEDWGNLADVGAAGDIAFKKDSWGLNPPTTWGWQAASSSPTGNGGSVVSQGYVAVALKLGGFPMGTVSFDNVVLTPEPATMSLLALGGLALLRRRRHA